MIEWLTERVWLIYSESKEREKFTNNIAFPDLEFVSLAPGFEI